MRKCSYINRNKNDYTGKKESQEHGLTSNKQSFLKLFTIRDGWGGAPVHIKGSKAVRGSGFLPCESGHLWVNIKYHSYQIFTILFITEARITVMK